MKKFCAILIILVFILLVLLGCIGKDKVKQSDDSRLAIEAFDSIFVIKAAYQEKNPVILQEHLVPELAETILKDLFFEKAELSFNHRLVRINDSSVIVNLNWHGAWWTVKDTKLENRGVANLVLDKETMKLMQIDGDNPFSIPLSRK